MKKKLGRVRRGRLEDICTLLRHVHEDRTSSYGCTVAHRTPLRSP